MKKFTIITAIMLTVNLLSAQWVKQDLNYPYEGYFMDIFFIDQDHGWVVGHSLNEDLCFETIDGGITWSQIDGVTGNFNSVLFLDNFNGWIVGTQGIIWHWDNHEGIGLGWIKHEHLSDWHHFTGISFTDTIHGKISFITGGFNNGGVTETMDGGWNCNITFFTGKMYDVFFSMSFRDG